MNNYDQIEVVEKGVDEIEVVEKFNPFHDAAGKFSSSNGFKTYSANPNTKAGAMAIARSAAAGHGNTPNVHRESYGEVIAQNANWLGQGKQAKPRQLGYTTLRTRVETAAGLSGASATGASWQHQNAQQGVQTKPGRFMNQQQQPQKPTAQKPAQPNPQQQKPAQQAQQQPANNRKPVDGKDISTAYKYDSRKGGSSLDQVAEQQGYNGKPTLVKDKAEFSQAVKDSGIMAYRTIKSGTDVATGKHKTSDEFVNDLKNGDKFSHNGSGGQAYGAGIYIAGTSNPVKGRAPSRSATDSAKQDSKCYGNSTAKTVAMTLHKDANIGDYNQLQSQYSSIPSSTRRSKYGMNSNDGFAAFCASKGYDAVCAKGAGWGCDYIIVYNRTKLVIFDG